MDVIRLYKIGIKNVIALMGTSLTKEQITLIKRVSNNIIISLDGDLAGKKACFNVGKTLEQEGCNVSCILLKDNLDPDEFIIKYGKDSYYSLLNNPLSYNEFKINYLKEGKDLTKIEDQTIYINNVLEEIAKEEDLIKQELLLKKITLEFGIDSEILRKKLQNMKKSSKIKSFETKEVINKKKTLDKYEKATYGILYYMLYSYDACKYYEKKLNFLPYLQARYLANEIIYNYKHEQNLVVADFLTTLNDKKDLKDLMNIVLNEEQDLSDLTCFYEYISVINGYNKSQEVKRLKSVMEEEPDPEKKALIAEQIRLAKIGS